MQPTPEPFEWHHAHDVETMCVTSPDIGFFQALPGHPYETREPVRPGQPPCDLMATVADLAARVRYRRAQRPASPEDPILLAQLLALTYARARSSDPGEPRPAPADQLAAFGAEGAASVMYPLADPASRDGDTEETLVLVRGDHVIVITKSFTRATTDPIAWALFNQASTQSIVWDPARRPPVASVWPPGVFLEPGVAATARPGPRATLRAALAASAAGSDDERALAEALRRLFGGSEPLAQPVTPAMKQTYADYLKASCDDRALWTAIDVGLAQVENAYDLHGFAIVLHRELA
jgi:hypothetical protein